MSVLFPGRTSSVLKSPPPMQVEVQKVRYSSPSPQAENYQPKSPS